ncbi:MAG: diguanylate cyclase [Aquabacterium sp.]|nr:MAG: diguanylate cyclase [Aquabacterium sp.]
MHVFSTDRIKSSAPSFEETKRTITPDAMDPDQAPSAETPQAQLRREQNLRKRRIGMSTLSYSVSCMVVAFCWFHNMLPWLAVPGFVAATLVLNGFFWWLIHTGLNLRFKDPSMTAFQMVVSVLPAAAVMYLADSGQVRAVFLLLAIAPALYGVLALNTRQFTVVSLLIFAVYGGLMYALWCFKPHALHGSIEIVQSFAFFMVLAEITVMGGYIHGMRNKLSRRNQELKTAMADLQVAMHKISDLAIRDGLTGSYNRRHLFDLLAKEASRANRSQGCFSVAILDVDHFKQINDRHGHQKGDEVLCALTKEVESRLRTIDGFGRYGGEEFLVILAQTPLEGAMIKAERIREQIESLRVPGMDEGWRVTASIGVSEFHFGEDTVEDLVARADAALYKAKARGRNQVFSVVDDAELGIDQGLRSALASPRT